MKWWNKKPKKIEAKKELNEGKEWSLLSEDDLLENQDIEKKEDVVDTKERVIRRELETKLTINESQKVDISVQDRMRLTKRYLREEQEENQVLEDGRKVEETRANHVKSIQQYIYEQLSKHLLDEETIIKMQIDSKFENYMPEVLEEVEISYDVKEKPRNQDLVRLNPDIPLVYEFKIRSDDYVF